MSSEKFRIEVARHAQQELAVLEKENRLAILQAIQKFLSSRPFLPVKTRIKKMTGFDPVLYRLRVGDYRVYYRIQQQHVVVLGIVHKKDTKKWLK